MIIRYSPTDDDDQNDVERINAPQWAIDCLKLNPAYCSWGNGEDYMVEDERRSWGGSQRIASWSDIWTQDDLNEIANGYFFLSRDSKECKQCDGSGYNPETKKLSDGWYNIGGPRYSGWQYSLTDVEIEALMKSGRLSDLTDGRFLFTDGQWKELIEGEWVAMDTPPVMPTPNAVNAWAMSSKGVMGHDAINKWICVEARARHLGVWGKCAVCEGHGEVFLEKEARLSLQLWILHPRKGASRGLIVERIKQSELPAVGAFFQEALQRTHQRFDAMTGLATQNQ